MDRAVREAIAAIFATRGVTNARYNLPEQPDGVLFVLDDDDYERLDRDYDLWREISALLPHVKVMTTKDHPTFASAPVRPRDRAPK